MATKEFKIQYFQASKSLRSDLDARLRGNLMVTLERNGRTDISFFVARVPGHEGVFCLNKQRSTNLPKIADLEKRTDRPLSLAPEEGLVEKAYFAFDSKSGDLALQCNGSVCFAAAFPGIIKGLFRQAEAVSTVPLDRELESNDLVASVDISLAFPHGPDAVSDRDIQGNPLLQGLKLIAAGAKVSPSQSINLTITAARAKGEKESPRMRAGVIKRLVEKFGVKKARVLVPNEREVQLREGDEGVDPGLLLIDLMGTPKTSAIDVLMNDRYPDESDIAKQLLQCLTA